MSRNNLMGLFETQEYISSESHEWNVPFNAKEKVVKMVQKYNERAIKMGYNDSILDFDASSLTLRGIFVPKTEKTSWLAKRLEDGRNADLSGDIMRILALCNKVCPYCHSQIPALAKECEMCGKKLIEKGYIRQDNEVMSQESDMKEFTVEETKEVAQHLKYELFDKPIAAEVPEGVTYYDTVLAFFNDFIAKQKEKPKDDVSMGFTLDFDKMDSADTENIQEDDLRLGVSSFIIQNEFFSWYNDYKPLFEEKVKSGSPQIFIQLAPSDIDLDKYIALCEKYKISYALETGINPMLKFNYKELTFSFNDDAEAAACFFCYVADTLLSVPKDTPVDAFISSDRSKNKAQKEFKKTYSFSAKDYAMGATFLLKDKITGK
ncbi:unknown [Prevotella sp. CAG:487]|nr:unknown [Prevotella sp. CAG:487]